MKSLPILTAALLMLAAGSARAATCAEEATQKKLSGAALASFTKECEGDAA